MPYVAIIQIHHLGTPDTDAEEGRAEGMDDADIGNGGGDVDGDNDDDDHYDYVDDSDY